MSAPLLRAVPSDVPGVYALRSGPGTCVGYLWLAAGPDSGGLAPLLAAAPNLLRVLRQALWADTTGAPQDREAIRAALALATPEGTR